MESSLASLATSMQGGRMQQEISVAILKQILDSQQNEAQMLLGMLGSPSPSLDGTGQIVNIGA